MEWGVKSEAWEVRSGVKREGWSKECGVRSGE